MTAAALQVANLAQRSLIRTSRQPVAIIGPLIFPLSLLAVNSAGLRPSTALPGFPTSSFLSFALAVPFLQGALFAMMNAGTDLARDIQTGFLNRLALTPLRGSALVAGQLAGAIAMGFVQAVAYLCIGIAFGAQFESGVAGAFVLLALATLIAAGFGALGVFLALRTGSGEAVQSVFPIFFVALFISSMNTPRNLIAVDWFRYVADANPVSYLLEGIRSLIITGWDGQALGLAFGIAAALLVAGLALASSQLPKRLTRT